jgi:peptidoglycan LD-endopeptidase LytH
MWTVERRARGRWVAALALGVSLGACGPALAPLPPAQAPAPSEVLSPAPVRTAPLSISEELRARRLMVPVDGIDVAKLNDSFGAQRDGGARQHGAIDIMAPRGTAVLAADDGRILRIGYNSLGGLTIYQIDASRRFVYYYAHLDRYASTLRDGLDVARGDLIGYVGHTGNASPAAPHLHFQVMLYRERYWEGDAVNPFGAFELPGKRN